MFVGQLLCLHTFVLAHGGRDLHHMARASQLYMDYTVYECVVICVYIYMQMGTIRGYSIHISRCISRD